MDRSDHESEQLSRLAAALCDEEITREEAARLEQIASQSEEALDYFVHYLQLHGEVCWAAGHGLGRRRMAQRTPPPAEPDLPVVTAARPKRSPVPQRKRNRRNRWAVAATAAAVLVVAGLGALLFFGGAEVKTPSTSSPEPLAWLDRTVRAQWSSGATAWRDGVGLVAGQTLALKRGLAEVRFRSGARVVLEGPASFRVNTGNGSYLESGSLVAKVPAEAVGFTVGTPSATIVDRGTELGVAVQGGLGSEIHVFAGRVEVRPVDPSRPGNLPIELVAGQTFRVRLAADRQPEIVEVPKASRQFVRAMPPMGPSARLRALVAAHPHLIHHYTFEGATYRDKCLDRRGKLHLGDVSMVAGDGGGDFYELAPGFDPESNAVRPYRSPVDGNTVGVGLQSRAGLPARSAMTVELLLKLEKAEGWTEETVCTAVASRGRQQGCGFYVAALDRGQLAYRLAGEARWGLTDVTLALGDWYYVAATFRADAGQTVVDFYSANLTRGEGTLTRAVRERRTGGVPAAGRLGIGTGYDDRGAAAYPWPGILDEVAIYDTALAEEALQEHLTALVGPP